MRVEIQVYEDNSVDTPHIKSIKFYPDPVYGKLINARMEDASVVFETPDAKTIDSKTYGDITISEATTTMALKCKSINNHTIKDFKQVGESTDTDGIAYIIYFN